MLGGIAPILIFYFPTKIKIPGVNALSGIPILDQLPTQLGVPIPVYLDENLTGILVDTESKAIDIDTVAQQRNDGGPPLVNQRGLNNLVTINMIAKRDSIILAMLLALNDMIFQRVVSREYSVSYTNGPTTIFGGLLHGFSSTAEADTDLVNITMQISKSSEQGTAPPNTVAVLPKITGATPVAVTP